MSIIGYVLLSLAFYVCGIIATYTCITVTPILFRNGLSRRYPLHMSFLFPISLLLNIVPRGFRVFFLRVLSFSVVHLSHGEFSVSRLFFCRTHGGIFWVL